MHLGKKSVLVQWTSVKLSLHVVYLTLYFVVV